MIYEKRSDFIESNVEEAEEMLSSIKSFSGMLLVYMTRAGKERSARFELSGKISSDCRGLIKNIVTDGAVRFIAIGIRLPERLEYDYFKGLMKEAAYFRIDFLDYLVETRDEDGEFVMSYKEGIAEMKKMHPLI